jgi:hypothetical protein
VLKGENISHLLSLLRYAGLKSKALSVYSSSVISLYEELVLLLVRNARREVLVFMLTLLDFPCSGERLPYPNLLVSLAFQQVGEGY